MASKPGPKPGTVNNPKGINQYSTSGPTNGRTNNQRQLKANKPFMRTVTEYAGEMAKVNAPVHPGLKNILGMSTSGPKQRSIVGASRVLKNSSGKGVKTLSNADNKFVNYRIQTSGGNTPTPGANAESLTIYKRMKKIKQ